MVKYEKDYLMEVSLKIEFEEEIELNQEIADSKFREILKERFPVAAFEKNLVKDGEDHGKMWIFQKGDKQIELNDSSIKIVYNEDGYNCKEELFEDVNLIFKVLDNNRIDEVKNISLRFINEIRPKCEKIENINEWINPQLINYEFESDEFRIIRAMSRYEYKIDEEFYLNFQFGQFNENYPLPYIHDNFILDYEACVEYAETEDLENIIKKMHEVIINFFKKSIGNGLREDMGEIND